MTEPWIDAPDRDAQPLIRGGVINLRVLSETIQKRRITVMVAMLTALVFAVAYLHVAEIRYAVRLEIAPRSIKSKEEGRGLSSLASLAGVKFGSEGPRQFRLFLGALRSPFIAEKLAADDGLLRKMFYQEWSDKEKLWRQPASVGRSMLDPLERVFGTRAGRWDPPGKSRVYDYLNSELKVIQDAQSGVVTLEIDSARPEVAAEILVQLTHTIDDEMRRRDLARAGGYIDYLTHRLSDVTVEDYREILIGKLAQLEKIKMLSSSALPYAGQILGKPVVSTKPLSPMPLAVIAAGIMLGALAGVVLAAIEHHTFSPAGRMRISSLFRLFTLYATLVFYSAVYIHFQSDQVTPLLHNDYVAFDGAKSAMYRLIMFLTPLAALPLGTRLRSPGQIIAGALVVLLFIPIPIVFVPMVTPAEFWGIYWLLWAGYCVICAMSSMSVDIRLPVISNAHFRNCLVWMYLLFVAGFLAAIATNHVALVGLNQAHEARGDVTVSGIQGYILVGYITSFGGLLIAMSVMYRKYYLIALAIVGFVICYATIEERNAILMPAWILYVFLTQICFYRDSIARYVLAVMAPFLVGTFLVSLIGVEDQESFLYDAFTLANFRLFSVPPVAFNVYFNFFQTHPLTYWSHINAIGTFVGYPYGEPLSLVMSNAYHMGNYNASFLETDGLAAGGVAVLPFISLLFGGVLLIINSLMRQLNLTLCAIVMAGPSIAMIDTGLGPSLLTNGLAFLALFLAFAPRDASWNMPRREKFRH